MVIKRENRTAASSEQFRFSSPLDALRAKLAEAYAAVPEEEGMVEVEVLVREERRQH